jgi:predicted deacetylase
MNPIVMPSRPAGQPRKLLLASIHDVGPRFDREIDVLVNLLEGLLGEPRFAMLVVPNHWGEAPLQQHPAFQNKLRAWADAGVEMFVHGWFHKDYASHSGFQDFRARNMTAGEGEFLGLDREDASQRMADGKDLIEDIIGRPVAGFIAPAWLYGSGARDALKTSGFALAEDHFRVWEPDSGKIVARGPVITWASRSRNRQLSSLAFAGIARHALRGLATARVAVHPGDAGVPELLESITKTVVAFAANRSTARYADLLAKQPAAS